MATVNQPTGKITRKVAGGALGGVTGGAGAAVVLVWILKTNGVEIPVEVAAVIGGWMGAAGASLSAYMTKERG